MLSCVVLVLDYGLASLLNGSWQLLQDGNTGQLTEVREQALQGKQKWPVFLDFGYAEWRISIEITALEHVSIFMPSMEPFSLCSCHSNLGIKLQHLPFHLLQAFFGLPSGEFFGLPPHTTILVHGTFFLPPHSWNRAMLLFLFKCSILDLSCCRREAAATLLSPSIQALGVLPNYIIGNLHTDPSFSVCIVLSHLINKTSDHCSSPCWIWSS